MSKTRIEGGKCIMKRNVTVVGLAAVFVMAVCVAGCKSVEEPIEVDFPHDEGQISQPDTTGGLGDTGSKSGGDIGIDVVEEKTIDTEPEPEARKWNFDDPVKGLLTVYFEFDKSELTPEARADIETNARRLKKHKDVNVLIEGHCDERGTIEYNMALGERRALAVRNYLIDLGVSPNRLATISYGEEVPIDPRHNEEAWGKNRRAKFNASSQ